MHIVYHPSIRLFFMFECLLFAVSVITAKDSSIENEGKQTTSQAAIWIFAWQVPVAESYTLNLYSTEVGDS